MSEINNKKPEPLNLPLYQSHKQVRGARITAITRRGLKNEKRVLVFGELGRDVEVEISDEWFDRHKPERGGYYVVYADGYTSFSPPDAFELGNSRLEMTGSELKASMEIQSAINGLSFKGAEIALNHAMEAVIRRKEAVMVNTQFFSDNKEG